MAEWKKLCVLRGRLLVLSVGNAFTLIDIHSVLVLWSGSTLVLIVVIFSFVTCLFNNEFLAKIHTHDVGKMKNE